MAQYENVRIADLKEGDVVIAHGGMFEVLHDAMESQGHRPKTWASHTGHASIDGPCHVAYSKAICISGEIKGYFKPGSPWTFQGATWITVKRLTK